MRLVKLVFGPNTHEGGKLLLALEVGLDVLRRGIESVAARKTGFAVGSFAVPVARKIDRLVTLAAFLGLRLVLRRAGLRRRDKRLDLLERLFTGDRPFVPLVV